ncbi:MAG: ATP-binding protein [Elusimicrobia bacterium]|jgi:signal transduction histidine kinase|nr:ATP-binding protein [Elusimicrobiota bacterium]
MAKKIKKDKIKISHTPVSVLRFRYIFVLAFLGILACLGYLTLAKTIEKQQSHAAIINISGRQRMLSQKVALYLLHYMAESNDVKARNIYNLKINEAISLMESQHNGLLNGNPEMNLPGDPPPSVKEIYFSPPRSLDLQVRSYIKEARQFSQLDIKIQKDQKYINYIASASDSILDGLDYVVREYQVVAERDNRKLIYLQFLLMLTTIVVLVLSGIFVFRPLFKKINIYIDKLSDSVAALKKSNRELDNFVVTVSHDLGAPLRAIKAFADFLDDSVRDRLTEQDYDYLSEIKSATVRMDRLIKDILSLSKLSKIKNPYENVDIKKTINGILSDFKNIIDSKNIKLTIAENIPSIYCDRIKIKEVFKNLIDNALKYQTDDDGHRIEVKIGYKEKSKYHQFYVKDNGIGLDMKFRIKVLDIFTRLNGDGYQGTGVGLNIIKRIIEEHRGEINVVSEPGAGSKFIFTISKDLR